MMHWDIWAVLPPGTQRPFWRLQLCKAGFRSGEIYDCFGLHAVRVIVRYYDTLYPVYIQCSWSSRVQIEASKSLQRAGITLTEDCIPF